MNLQTKIDDKNVNVVFRPIEGSSQEWALASPCHHTLYHGTRGPGKTATQLMRFMRNVGKGYGRFWRGIIFDFEFKNLDDLIAQSQRFFLAFENGCKFKASASSYKWTWPTGEELLFRQIKKISDYNKFHGHEYPFIGWNELTKYPTADLYKQMMSCNRSSFDPEIHTPRNKDGSYATDDGNPLPPIPLEVFSTTNPSGAGHNWVKKMFISCAENGQVVKRKYRVYSPKFKKIVDVYKTQVAIFGSYRENKFLSDQYIATLDEITKNNPNLRAAWLMGSWDVTAGGVFDDLWDSNIHIVDRFRVPENWYVDRSFDWGSTHPFSVGWWAEANGEEVTLEDGRKWCPAAGSLIRVFEWYGTNEIGSNKGLKLSARDIARGIVNRERVLTTLGWISKIPEDGPADNQIRNVTESDTATFEEMMRDEGVTWGVSYKSAGTRIQGVELMRNRLQASVEGEGPGIYFMRNCIAAIETIPSLPRDEKNIDDVDTNAEDHCWDETRYRLLSDVHRYSRKIDVKYQN